MSNIVTTIKSILITLLIGLMIGCGGEKDNSNGKPDPDVVTNPKPDPVITNPNTGVIDPTITAAEAAKMADSVIARSPNGYGGWNYETATLLRGFEELYKATGDKRYYNYLKTTVDNAVSSKGAISGYSEGEYNIDQIKEGSLALYLYQVTGEEKYKIAAKALRQQLLHHPRTNAGGFWHKKKYAWQMWLDGLYMGQPFYAHYAKLFDEANYDDILLQFTEMETHAVDSTTGLLYHAWDEAGKSSWADNKGRSPVFWGRAIGWYLMALVDTLDHIPANYKEHRAELIKILQRQVKAIEAFQDTDGVWWQVVNKVGEKGNWQESSATAMYVYAIAKGVRKGYLNQAHLPTATKGWAGLNKVFITQNSNGTVSLTNTCNGTGVGGSLSFYYGRGKETNDSKGLGPYILAGVEVGLLK